MMLQSLAFCLEQARLQYANRVQITVVFAISCKRDNRPRGVIIGQTQVSLITLMMGLPL